VQQVPDDHCRRTGQFQVVFTDTRLDPHTELQIGGEEDAEWQAAAQLVLAALRSDGRGVTATNAAWQDLTMWLDADERLDTFIKRALKTVDAAVWLLSLSVRELGDHPKGDALKRLQRLVLSRPLRD
jgi:hypothetical protein